MKPSIHPETRQLPKPTLGAALVGEEEEALVLQVLRSQDLFRYYGKDKEHPPSMVATLEKEFREMTGSGFSLAVTSGTAALECSLAALGIGPGDEVIVPAWSWISCFTAIVRVGATPVMAEIDETLCLARGEILRLRTRRTKAVSVIHYQGEAADIEPLVAEANAAGIDLIEDCAQSPGVSYRGRKVGTFGRIGTFSFQHNKAITSGEGGILVTDDPKLYERAVRMHDLGQYRCCHQELAPASGESFCGSQFRMPEVTAAIALAQVRKLEIIREHCRHITGRISAKIRNLPCFEFRRVPDPGGGLNFESYLFLENPELAKRIKTELEERGISSRQMTGTYSHYHREYCRNGRAHSPGGSPFTGIPGWPVEGYRAEDFPRTEGIVHRFVAIPIGLSHTLEDADYIADALIDIHSSL